MTFESASAALNTAARQAEELRLGGSEPVLLANAAIATSRVGSYMPGLSGGRSIPVRGHDGQQAHNSDRACRLAP
jgi:hypothetical protein